MSSLITNLGASSGMNGTEEFAVNFPGAPDVDQKVTGTQIKAFALADLGDSAGLDLGTTAGTVCAGDDSRLGNARTPSAHATSHTNGDDDIQAATASQKGLATAAQISKLDGIEASADVTDAANVGGSMDGSAAVTTLGDSDKLPLTQSGGLKTIAYSAFKTLLNAVYALKGAATSSGLTMSTARLLGRTTASTGAVEEITVGSGLSLTAGTLAPSGVTEAMLAITDVTTGNAGTSAHGFSPKATAPSSGMRSVLGIDNGETARADKALFDATTPAALGGAAAVGTAMAAARRDHVHALPWRETLALSDLTTALTASGSVVVATYVFMEARTLSSIHLAVLTAPTGAALEVEAKKNGTTIWTTKPTIDASETSTLTAATPGVLATTSFAAGDILNFYISQVGSTLAGAGLQAYMKGVF